MITQETIRLAKTTADELRERGERERAQAIDALVEAARDETVERLDLLTSREAGELLGVSGQTIKNWVKQGQLRGFRVGGRIMIPRDLVAGNVRRARGALDLEEVSDEEAARLVAEGRRGQLRGSATAFRQTTDDATLRPGPNGQLDSFAPQ